MKNARKDKVEALRAKATSALEPKLQDDQMLILPDITKKNKPFFLQSKFDKEPNYNINT